ncbi:MAG: SGNH/GDSL hydrolase family protein [Vicinamibacterales bacterium]
MNGAPVPRQPSVVGRRLRRLALLAVIVVVQFQIFEAGLRLWGSSEAAPSFQGLFEDDPAAGYRLKPNARIRFATSEFDTEIAINGAGVRDDEELGPKGPNERRIVILGDSIVLSVQVSFGQTFGELLETTLNERSRGVRYRVVNAGVQGYGPIEEMLAFRRLAHTFQPDVVLMVVFVANDAEEAYGSRSKLDPDAQQTAAAISESLLTRLRRLVRRSMVLQIVRLRVNAATARFRTFTPPEPPAQSYAAEMPPRVAEGLTIARDAFQTIAEDAGQLGARSALVLMPARFQVDEGDYGRLRDIIKDAGGELVRDAASVRFDEALSDLPLPRFDVLPAFRRALPGPHLFFQTTVHLTPRGHRVVADALADFLAREGLVEDAETMGR